MSEVVEHAPTLPEIQFPSTAVLPISVITLSILASPCFLSYTHSVPQVTRKWCQEGIRQLCLQ